MPNFHVEPQTCVTSIMLHYNQFIKNILEMLDFRNHGNDLTESDMSFRLHVVSPKNHAVPMTTKL